MLWFMRNRPELARDMRMMFNAHSYVVFRAHRPIHNGHRDRLLLGCYLLELP